MGETGRMASASPSKRRDRSKLRQGSSKLGSGCLWRRGIEERGLANRLAWERRLPVPVHLVSAEHLLCGVHVVGAATEAEVVDGALAAEGHRNDVVVLEAEGARAAPAVLAPAPSGPSRGSAPRPPASHDPGGPWPDRGASSSRRSSRSGCCRFLERWARPSAASGFHGADAGPPPAPWPSVPLAGQPCEPRSSRLPWETEQQSAARSPSSSCPGPLREAPRGWPPSGAARASRPQSCAATRRRSSRAPSGSAAPHGRPPPAGTPHPRSAPAPLRTRQTARETHAPDEAFSPRPPPRREETPRAPRAPVRAPPSTG